MACASTLLPRTRLYCSNCGENVGTLRITNLIYSRKAGGCEGISIFHGTAARRGKGISDSAPQGYLLRGTAADLIASHAPLRNGSHKARQNGPKHYPRGFKGPPTGAPPKPNEVGLVGRGGAAERLSFCPERQNEGCGACDDEARLSPLSFVVQRKIGPPEVVGFVERLVKSVDDCTFSG